MPLFLTANGLYSKHTMVQFLSLLPQVKTDLTACIITTADVQYKNKNKHAVRTKDLFYANGFAKVDYVDLDTDPANLLLNYDVININGGNPFYLLDRIRDSGALVPPIYWENCCQKVSWYLGIVRGLRYSEAPFSMLLFFIPNGTSWG